MCLQVYESGSPQFVGLPYMAIDFFLKKVLHFKDRSNFVEKKRVSERFRIPI